MKTSSKVVAAGVGIGILGLIILARKASASNEPVLSGSALILPRPPIKPNPATAILPPAGPVVHLPPAVSPNNAPATSMPVLPPGTTPAVAQAVQDAYDSGTLTEGQADAVSRLSAPLYNPQVIVPIDSSPQAAADAAAAQAQLNLTAEEILSGAGNQGTTAGPSLSVVDFGSAEAAQAALDDYYKNFV